MSPRPEAPEEGLARALAQEGERGGIARAAVALRALLRRAPGYREATLHLARLERASCRPTAARRLLEGLPTRDGDGQVLALIGSICRGSGDTPGARRWLEAAVELEPPAPDAVGELGGLYLDLGLTEAARALAARTRAALPGRPEPRLVAARLELKEGRAERALELLAELVERFPDCHAALAARAEAERALGDHDRAKLSLRRALLIAPGRLAYRRRLARLTEQADAEASGSAGSGAWDRLALKAAIQDRARHHREQGTLAAGLRELLALSVRCRFEPLVWYELARLYAAAGEPRRALALAKRAVELDPGAPALRVEVARLQVEAGRPAEAAETLALLDPDGAARTDARLVEARAAEALGRTEAAAMGYGRLLAADPGLTVARLGLYRLASDAGRLEEAEQHLSKALAGGARDPELGLARVALLDRLGRAGDAEHQLEACATAHPERTGLALALARRRLGAGRAKAALECFRGLVRRGRAQTREARLDLVEALLALRRPRAAARLLRAVSRAGLARTGPRAAVLAAWLAVLQRNESRLEAAGQRAWRRGQDSAPEVAVMLGTLGPRDRDLLAHSLARLARLYPREATIPGLLARLQGAPGRRGRLASLPGSA